ncbi:serine/threonine protein phosphatase [Mycobacterium sp. IS-1496]|uniref:GAF domain-containing SpoIIE family protein phosphatase n=1 Tax=Mycobacterium sp. IS-1496 TaxID=1772284 RepID=UPI0007416B02|nr:GAF domain-containing SpoIIE family protein phosphatase [Mycobacterium sp. IS-1496]KUI26244.1 serine/threonine protein phosphatase [Mycobacterium sp. IS-1496]
MTVSPYALPPEVEDERVRSLAQLHVLDTPPEDRFARITRMARHVFEIPMAAVALVDRDRQWFKQVDGLDIGTSLPRTKTICQATIARTYEKPDNPALIIEDAAARPEFAMVPGIGEPGGIRFYAGYPLYGPGGHPVGTFCIYDTEPRSLTEAELGTFFELASWAQRELEQTDDIERAAEVQRHLLPRALGDLPGYSVCAMCLPAYAVGGDFYDHYRVDGGAVFTVADVMGKGLGAAILAASVRSALRGASRAVDEAACGMDLEDVVKAVAEQLADDLGRTDTFVTLFHCQLDTETGTVRYVDAGHGFAVVVRADGRVDGLDSVGIPLGVMPGATWDCGEATLGEGDTLIVASDGVLDLIGDGTDVWPALRFVARHSEPADLCARARALVAEKSPLDDVTLVAVRREPTA